VLHKSVPIWLNTVLVATVQTDVPITRNVMWIYIAHHRGTSNATHTNFFSQHFRVVQMTVWNKDHVRTYWLYYVMIIVTNCIKLCWTLNPLADTMRISAGTWSPNLTVIMSPITSWLALTECNVPLRLTVAYCKYSQTMSHDKRHSANESIIQCYGMYSTMTYM